MASADIDDLQAVPAAALARGGVGDRVFSGLATGAGVIILATLAGVALFLMIEAWPAITADGADLPGGESLLDYIWPLAFGTLVAATIAIVIAVPLAVAVALFISHIAPRRIAQPLSYLIDLLAAIPSVIYGLWGIAVLGPASVGLLEWLADNARLHPVLRRARRRRPAARCSSRASCSRVMILPIITAVTRSVFEQTPRRLQEGALALGATRWEMIRLTVLPFGKSAIISASMLGLGRALGETMAVAIVLSVSGARHLQPDRLGQPVDDRGATSRSTSRSPPGSRSTR